MSILNCGLVRCRGHLRLRKLRDYSLCQSRNKQLRNCFPPAPQRFALSLACPFAHQSPSKYFSYLAALIYTSHGSKQRRVPGTLIETPEISFETMDGFLV
ncbi:hypothetical protein AFLA_006019 [Aspergillus flavus NRRL3357]|nr:hypothetical protein AFLA_006019 [Aspergillus flavus NRRL3357]